MPTHDPRQVIEDLRNHLAPHDRRIAFLFGAGTSMSVNLAPVPPAGQKRNYEPLVPGIAELTASCASAVEALGKKHAKAWTAVIKHCEQKFKPANVEHVLSNVRMKIDALGDGETLVGVSREQLKEIEKTICATIANAASPAEEKMPKHLPHDDLAGWVKKVNRTAALEIFTTNYDILFERAFEAARVPIFDGFVGGYQPFFYGDCLDDDELLPNATWVRVWKLHGSINWKIDKKSEGGRIIRTYTEVSGDLILPSHRKYDESRKQPYMAFIDRLAHTLNSEHALLIVSGYSFGDEHINAILYGALDNRPTVNVIVLHYDELHEQDDLVRAAKRRSRLQVIGPNGGVVSGDWGEWQLAQAVDKTTCSFMDSAFDSNALPEDKGSPAAATADLKGKMRLGDFNSFCRFLGEMGPSLQ